jgi:hypothetical protein
MKKVSLVTVLIAGLILMSFAQKKDLPIVKFETRNQLVMGHIIRPITNFKIYNDSLVMTAIGGAGFNQYKKNNIPVKTVHPYKASITIIGDIHTYKYENETISIIISITNKKKVVVYRVKDLFTGKVSEMMYY